MPDTIAMVEHALMIEVLHDAFVKLDALEADAKVGHNGLIWKKSAL